MTCCLKGKGSTHFAIGVACVFLLIGLAILAHDLRVAYWPSVPGKLITAEIGINQGEGTTYYAKLRYDYSVNGQHYQGYDQGWIATGDRSRAERQIAALQRQQEVDNHITIYYNPAKPAESSAEARFVSPFGMGFSGFSLGFLLLITASLFADSKRHLSGALGCMGLGSFLGSLPCFPAALFWGLTWWVAAIWAATVLFMLVYALRHSETGEQSIP